jgi:Transcription factor WhiB
MHQKGRAMTISPSARRHAGQAAGRGDRAGRAGPASLSDEQLAGRVMSPLARCSGPAADPDEWFPVAAVETAARSEAQRALALCAACPVRGECLELSLRQWRTIGKHGIWGGLVEAERAAVRREWLAGAEVTALLAVAGRDGDGLPGAGAERVPVRAGRAAVAEGVLAGAGKADPLLAAGPGGARRAQRRPAGARATGKRARRRSPRTAGAQRRPLVEQ